MVQLKLLVFAWSLWQRNYEAGIKPFIHFFTAILAAINLGLPLLHSGRWGAQGTQKQTQSSAHLYSNLLFPKPRFYSCTFWSPEDQVSVATTGSLCTSVMWHTECQNNWALLNAGEKSQLDFLIFYGDVPQTVLSVILLISVNLFRIIFSVLWISSIPDFLYALNVWLMCFFWPAESWIENDNQYGLLSSKIFLHLFGWSELFSLGHN